MSALKRQLSARHLSMIALGGSLGTGIFLTSGSALYYAGPGGALLAYLLMGLMVYLLMSSLGEMAAYRPISGSFCQYATDYVDPSFGFAMGYNYWFNWAITIAVELVAAAIVMKFWFPAVPSVIWCGLFFVAIFTLNCMPVKNYGETEYWLALIKIAAIIVFVVVGIAIIIGFNTEHHSIGLQNWQIGDAPFHGGMHGLLLVFLLSGFAFQGSELVGITAGEAKEPQRSIPRAIKQVFWRILIFYVLTMAIISFVIPYTDHRLLNTSNSVSLSPFSLVLLHIGFKQAASVMNVVILIAVLSACNSDMYSATRILWHLGQQGSAPKFLGKINRHGVPFYALLFTAAFGLLALLTNYIGTEYLFLWLVNVSSLAGFLAWIGIGLSHYYFRKNYINAGNELSDLPYQARFYPWGPIIVIVLCSLIIIGQAYILVAQGNFTIQNLLATYIGLPCILLLFLGHKYYTRQRGKNLQQA